MHCPNCGNPNPDSYLYCVRCGAELQEITEEYLIDWNDYTVAEEPEKPVLPPVRKIGFGEAVKNFFTHYADFKGRATLREFWFAYLFLCMTQIIFVLVLSFAAAFLSAYFNNEDLYTIILFVPYTLYVLVLACPSYALIWRRLHDAGKSGAFYFLGLIPIANFVVAFYILFIPSDGDNKYGPRKVAQTSSISPDLYS